MKPEKKPGEKTWYVEVETIKTTSMTVFARDEEEAKEKALAGEGEIEEEGERGGEVSHIEETEDD